MRFISLNVFQWDIERIEMDKWECTVCGYIYDPELGDPEHNIPPQTPFEQLPENWACPVCGAPKSQFVKRQQAQ